MRKVAPVPVSACVHFLVIEAHVYSLHQLLLILQDVSIKGYSLSGETLVPSHAYSVGLWLVERAQLFLPIRD